MNKATQISLHIAQDQPPLGHIYSYDYYKKRSGLIRAQDNETYSFSIDASIDKALRKEMLIPVNFEMGKNDKGPIAIKISLHSKKNQSLRGHICCYEVNQSFGFIFSENEEDEEPIYFSPRDIIDEALREKILIPVNFEMGENDNGPIAIKISRHRTKDQPPRGYIQGHGERFGFIKVLNEEDIEFLNKDNIYFYPRDIIDEEELRKEMLIPVNFQVVQKSNGSNTENLRQTAKQISRPVVQGQTQDELPRDKQNVQPDVPDPEDQLLSGFIVQYHTDGRDFGQILDQEGKPYFFHLTAITDEVVRDAVSRFDKDRRLPVSFLREYPDPAPSSMSDPQATEIRIGINTSFLRGSNPFAIATRAEGYEKDFDRAEQFYKQAISEDDNLEDAVKNWAQLRLNRGSFKEALEVIENYEDKIHNKQSLENVRIQICTAGDMHDKLIELLPKLIERGLTKEKEATTQRQLANSFFARKKYEEAVDPYTKFLEHQPDNVACKHNLAYCLACLGQYDEAKSLLNEILSSPNKNASELLRDIMRAESKGEPFGGTSSALDEDYSIGLSEFKFTQFFFERYDFQDVQLASANVRTRKFESEDIHRFESLATIESTPSQCASNSIAVAKIISILNYQEDRYKFYRLLGRYFASKGYAVINDTGDLDAARECYAEALRVYDRDLEHKETEWCAHLALVGFLYSLLNDKTRIPQWADAPPTIASVINEVVTDDNFQKIFDDITYLIFLSDFTKDRLLWILFDQDDLCEKALQYFRAKDVQTPNAKESYDEFKFCWNKLIDELAIDTHKLSHALTHDDFNDFHNNFPKNPAWLKSAIKQAEGIVPRLRLDLDQTRIRLLKDILEEAVKLCENKAFETTRWGCEQIDKSCSDFLKETRRSPTRISIEMLYPIVENIQETVKKYFDKIYKTSIPQLTLYSPFESYVPRGKDRKIDVQVVIKNEKGRNPAEDLALVPEKNPKFFETTKSEIKYSDVPGGEQDIQRVTLHLTKEAVKSKTFSLSVYARYRSRATDKKTQTPPKKLDIRLEEEFENFTNPYTKYAGGNVVYADDMFFGRTELIKGIEEVILGRTELIEEVEEVMQSPSKSVLIYGQKRSGKSSILYHLKTRLEKYKDILVLDVGNIGATDEHGFFNDILRELENAVEDRVKKGFSSLDLSVPNVYSTPFDCVKNNFGKLISTPDWSNMRVVLLIDEFQNIYKQILADKISESFMENWRALLQRYFTAVLVGQDVMPKFILAFPHAFNTTDEQTVTSLEPKDARQLIDVPIRIGGRQGESRYRENAIDRILYLTAGSPFYIQIICDLLVKYMNANHARLVTELDVEEVKDKFIRGDNALILKKFDNLINSGDTSEDAIPDEHALKILKAIADNSEDGPCHYEKIGGGERVKTILEDLVNRDVVKSEQNVYYSIKVGLFNEWLKEYEPPPDRVPTTDYKYTVADNKRKDTETELRKVIIETMQNQYGDDWVTQLEDRPPLKSIFENSREKIKRNNDYKDTKTDTKTLIDNIEYQDHFKIIFADWNWNNFSDIFGDLRSNWKQNQGRYRPTRNNLAHSKPHYISDNDLEKFNEFCDEILTMLGVGEE